MNVLQRFPRRKRRKIAWIFPATAVATIAFLVLGSWLFPDKPDERAEVEAFFKQVTTPQS